MSAHLRIWHIAGVYGIGVTVPFDHKCLHRSLRLWFALLTAAQRSLFGQLGVVASLVSGVNTARAFGEADR
jgi:hypothetical protein